MDTITVKITKATKDLYWYKNHIGEVFEVRGWISGRLVNGEMPDRYKEQCFTLVNKSNTGADRYIHYDDCVDCGRYLKLNKLKNKLYGKSN